MADQTAGYSGADIELVCRESAMMPVRRLMKKIDELDRQEPGAPSRAGQLPHQPQRGMKIARPGDVEALLRADPVSQDDIAAALRTTKPSSDGNILRYKNLKLKYFRIFD